MTLAILEDIRGDINLFSKVEEFFGDQPVAKHEMQNYNCEVKYTEENVNNLSNFDLKSNVNSLEVRRAVSMVLD